MQKPTSAYLLSYDGLPYNISQVINSVWYSGISDVMIYNNIPSVIRIMMASLN